MTSQYDGLVALPISNNPNKYAPDMFHTTDGQDFIRLAIYDGTQETEFAGQHGNIPRVEVYRGAKPDPQIVFPGQSPLDPETFTQMTSHSIIPELGILVEQLRKKYSGSSKSYDTTSGIINLVNYDNVTRIQSPDFRVDVSSNGHRFSCDGIRPSKLWDIYRKLVDARPLMFKRKVA